MLDNHDRVAFAFQMAYDFQQQDDVVEVQVGGGFVEQAVACIPANRKIEVQAAFYNN